MNSHAKFLVKHLLEGRFTLPYHFARAQLASRSNHLSNPQSNGDLQGITIHLLTGAKQMPMVRWMLLSFFLQTERNWKIFVYSDGTLTANDVDQLSDEGYCCEYISKENADELANQHLVSLNQCRSHREQFFMARKFYDPFIFSPSEKYLVLDSDLIFFKRPNEMIKWADHDRAELWFNEDIAENSQLSAEQALQNHNFELWPKVNAGLGCISKAAINFTDTERFLEVNDLLEKGDAWMLEQTLYALHASQFNKGGLLPADYEVSLTSAKKPETKCRHYVAAVRDQFFTEGVRELRKQLIHLQN